MVHEPTSALSTATESLHDAVSVDVLFDVLSHEYRRHALSFLAHVNHPLPVEELVDHVESCVDSDSVTRRRMALSLRHTHLPKMDDAGMLDYDPDREVVEPTSATESLRAPVEELTS